MVEISTVRIASVPKMVGVERHLAGSFPKTYRSVMVHPFLVVEQSGSENRPRGGAMHTVAVVSGMRPGL